MNDYESRRPGIAVGKDFEKFNEWATRRFMEIKRVYPNLVWNSPQISKKKIVWTNLHESIKVICTRTSSGRTIREVYLDSARQTSWDWEE